MPTRPSDLVADADALARDQLAAVPAGRPAGVHLGHPRHDVVVGLELARRWARARRGNTLDR